jgi:hypothetical protein
MNRIKRPMPIDKICSVCGKGIEKYAYWYQVPSGPACSAKCRDSKKGGR